MWTWYFKNGNKRLQGGFVKGKREAIWTTWNEKGQKTSEMTYANDLLNGDYILFDTSGNVLSTTVYLNDLDR